MNLLLILVCLISSVVYGESPTLNPLKVKHQILLEEGVQVEKIVLQGQTHNTIMMRTVLTDGPDPAAVVADVIKSKL